MYICRYIQVGHIIIIINYYIVRYDKNLVTEEVKDFAKSHTFNRVPKSPSNPDIHKVSSFKPGFEMPREVIILSLWQPEQVTQHENNSLVWQFQLLSEEEVSICK